MLLHYFSPSIFHCFQLSIPFLKLLFTICSLSAASLMLCLMVISVQCVFHSVQCGFYFCAMWFFISVQCGFYFCAMWFLFLCNVVFISVQWGFIIYCIGHLSAHRVGKVFVGSLFQLSCAFSLLQYNCAVNFGL